MQNVLNYIYNDMPNVMNNMHDMHDINDMQINMICKICENICKTVTVCKICKTICRICNFHDHIVECCQFAKYQGAAAACAAVGVGLIWGDLQQAMNAHRTKRARTALDPSDPQPQFCYPCSTGRSEWTRMRTCEIQRVPVLVFYLRGPMEKLA
jgi:hypothetical protein